MGSIRDARRAGTAAAMIDTVSKRNVVQKAVSGSAAPRPYNVDPTKRTIKTAAPNPSTIPASVSTIDSRSTAVSMEAGCAPKAILKAISFVRVLTVYDMIP